MTELPDRKWLYHSIPSWVDMSDYWFVTICCQVRGRNQLANKNVYATIREAFLFYQNLGRIRVVVWTLMPDHLHFIAAFNHDFGMPRLIKNFKKYITIKCGILWQRGFFDHRLRSSKEFSEKYWYVLLNPVRAGLVKKFEDWPYSKESGAR
jgi:putative transposase